MKIQNQFEEDINQRLSRICHPLISNTPNLADNVRKNVWVELINRLTNRLKWDVEGELNGWERSNEN